METSSASNFFRLPVPLIRAPLPEKDNADCPASCSVGLWANSFGENNRPTGQATGTLLLSLPIKGAACLPYVPLIVCPCTDTCMCTYTSMCISGHYTQLILFSQYNFILTHSQYKIIACIILPIMSQVQISSLCYCTPLYNGYSNKFSI